VGSKFKRFVEETIFMRHSFISRHGDNHQALLHVRMAGI
jgi:hypothetical protein